MYHSFQCRVPHLRSVIGLLVMGVLAGEAAAQAPPTPGKVATPSEMTGVTLAGVTQSAESLAGGCPVSTCTPTDCAVGQSQNTQLSSENSVGCTGKHGTTVNAWARCYDRVAEGIPFLEPLTINSVMFGVQEASVDGIELAVVVYLDLDGCPPSAPGGDAIEICRKTVLVGPSDVSNPIPCGGDQECIDQGGSTCGLEVAGQCDGLRTINPITVDFTDVEPVVAPGREFIIEVLSVDDGAHDPGFTFLPAGNNLGQCAPTYIRAEECGAPGWIDLATFGAGFPDAHVVQSASVTFGGVGSVCGNGVIEGCEECDPPDGFNCDESCRLIPELCGNGDIDPGESCLSCPADAGCPAGTACSGGSCAAFTSSAVSLSSHVTLQDFGANFALDCWGYTSPASREYAIIGLSNGTAFVEITDPQNPVIVELIETPNSGQDMKVYQHYVYSSSDSGPSHVIDMVNIDNGVVTLVNTLDGGTHNMFVNEQSGFLYLAVGGPLVVVDLADPVNPELVDIWDSETHDVQVVNYESGPYAGSEIAFIYGGSTGIVEIVDVTDKANMFPVGSSSYPQAAYCHQGWLSEDRQYIYANDEADNIQRTLIFDVNDLSTPMYLGSFTTGSTATDHNLYVHDGFIYESNYTSGLRIFDAADPLNPVEVGYFDSFPGGDPPGFQGAWSVYPFFPSGTVILSDINSGLLVFDVSAALGLCPTDLNGDGSTDAADLAELLGAWGPNPDHAADLTGDDQVDSADLALLLGGWGPCG